MQRLQEDRNRSLKEAARWRKQGAHRQRSQEAATRRDKEWEEAILVEKCKKEQASD